MLEGLFHPAVARWFAGAFAAPTEPQAQAWPAIREGRHTLVAAPTGTGKTLAAFLAALDDLVRRGLARRAAARRDEVVYVSPLKALSNDIHRNLEVPLAGIRGAGRGGAAAGRDPRPGAHRRHPGRRARGRCSSGRRTSWSPRRSRSTSCSTATAAARMLATARTVIVDEIHAVAGRQARLPPGAVAGAAGRLVAGAAAACIRIGLSATQRPIEEVARFLVGGRARARRPACRSSTSATAATSTWRSSCRGSPLAAVMADEVWEEVYDRLAELIAAHRTTLVFVNTRRHGRAGGPPPRRPAGRGRRHLAPRQPVEGDPARPPSSGSSAASCGPWWPPPRWSWASTSAPSTWSASSARRARSPPSCSGWAARGTRWPACPRGGSSRSPATSWWSAAALLDAVRRGELDRLEIRASAARRPRPADRGRGRLRGVGGGRALRPGAPRPPLPRARAARSSTRWWRCWPRASSTRRGRRGAYSTTTPSTAGSRARRGARLAALTSGGAIPDNADYRVVLEPDGTFVGTVNEDFAIESMAGDIFQLGNTSWRILRIERGRVRVEDAQGPAADDPVLARRGAGPERRSCRRRWPAAPGGRRAARRPRGGPRVARGPGR